MIRHRRRAGRLGLAGVLLVCGCGGAHYGAVQATSAAGVRLASDDRAMSTLPALCLEIASLAGATDDCAPLREEGRAWSRVVGLLEAYSVTLARRAGHDDGSISRGMLAVGPANGAWAGLKTDDAAAANELSKIIRDLQSRPVDADALKQAILAADAPIQKLSAAIDSAVSQRLATIDLAETSVDVVRQRLQETLAYQPASARPKPTPPPAAPAAPAAPAVKRPDKPAPARNDDQDVRPAINALGTQLSRLMDATARQAMANQTAVPGSLAGLAGVQNDLESRRQRFEELRAAVGVFARAHKVLHENVEDIATDALTGKVLDAIATSGPPATEKHAVAAPSKP